MSKIEQQIDKVFEDYQLGNATLLSEAGIRAAKQAVIEVFIDSLPGHNISVDESASQADLNDYENGWNDAVDEIISELRGFND